MKVETERFGEIELDDERILIFPDGLPGFPTARRFTLMDIGEGHVFFWLQSLDDPALAFMAAVPWPFFPDYAPELSDVDQSSLGLERAQDALVLCLLTVHRDEGEVTANLLGPLVVNSTTREGRQVILADSTYPVRARLPAS